MIRILQSSWFSALLGCLLYLGVTFAMLSPGKFEGAVAAQKEETAKKTPNDDPSWRFRNPEFDQWINELKHEREALDLRAQQLQELALRLETERKELSTATQTVYQLQAEFDRNVIRIKDQEMDNIKRQAKVISNMSTDAAAVLLADMKEDEAVKVMFVMKPNDVSALLETIGKLGKTEAQHAANITEKLRRILPPDSKMRAVLPQ
ncbi:MAG TPA: hypothetical protein VK327_11275 [Candidatus Paceibacterota bacterium]|nr:hypothetical protein [Candidatus Paceibacterota bacterium]